MNKMFFAFLLLAFNISKAQIQSSSEIYFSTCNTKILKKMMVNLSKAEIEKNTESVWMSVYMGNRLRDELNESIGRELAFSSLSKKKPDINDVIKSYDSLFNDAKNINPNKITFKLIEPWFCLCLSSKDLISKISNLIKNVPLDSMEYVLDKFMHTYVKEINENKSLTKIVNAELTRIRDLNYYYSLQVQIDSLLDKKFNKKTTYEVTKNDMKEIENINLGNFRTTLIKKCSDKFILKYDIKEESNKMKIAEYCNCCMEKIATNQYVYKEDSVAFEDDNSPQYNEVILSCIEEISLGFNSKKNNTGDVIGKIDSTTLPFITSFGSGYKIKITINGVAKYFIFDTGATDMLIDSKTEKELVNSGAINKEDYLENAIYIGANSQIFEARTINMNNLKIGNYIVNNVKVGVHDDAILLCGRSLISKFSSFKINENSKTIVLYK